MCCRCTPRQTPLDRDTGGGDDDEDDASTSYSYQALLVTEQRRLNASSRRGVTTRLVKNWALSTCMGAIWFFGNILYGVGSVEMGSLGPSLGWPVYMVGMILTSNAAAVVAGEWRLSGGLAKLWLCGGLLLLVGAIVLVGVASSVSSSSR